jgi:hypothetical protein
MKMICELSEFCLHKNRMNLENEDNSHCFPHVQDALCNLSCNKNKLHIHCGCVPYDLEYKMKKAIIKDMNNEKYFIFPIF